MNRISATRSYGATQNPFAGGASREPANPIDAREMPRQRPSRAVVELVRPLIDGGRFAAKASLGAPLTVEAAVFTDGHDRVAASLWTRPDKDRAKWVQRDMSPVGNDRYRAALEPEAVGFLRFGVSGWIDEFATWHHKLTAELEAGHDLTRTLADGESMFAAASRSAKKARHDSASLLGEALESCRRGQFAGVFADPQLPDAMRRWGNREPQGISPVTMVWVDRERARFSAWYEFFPRSTWSTSTGSSDGRLDSLGHRLDYIAELGFDVVYLPPIHPIGTVNRKGPNNSVLSGPSDEGSPWAIGSDTGGHCTVDPLLGTISDVEALVDEAKTRGMEIALDIAFQCAPDHPWIDEHPTWFRHRSDGSIRFAENPPKRYEDIVPLDFESDDWEALWTELRAVFWFWIERGVRIFRVDNPHTKAFAFWEWCITTTRDRCPDVIFLAEAFTRPAVMRRLAKAGFTQSYTYFAWRSTADELAAYGHELSSETLDLLRPNFWPNTPDILTEELQHGGRSAFVGRAVLAATLSPSWGVYGPAFELGEHTPVAEGSEEYLDSEKYQPRTWNIEARHSLAPVLRRLNQIRRATPALQHLEGLRFHRSDNPAIVCYSKPHPGAAGGVLVVVNLDWHQRHAATVDIDWAAIELAYDQSYRLDDLLGGGTFEWRGARNYVELEAHGLNAHIFSVSGPPAGGADD